LVTAITKKKMQDIALIHNKIFCIKENFAVRLTKLSIKKPIDWYCNAVNPHAIRMKNTTMRLSRLGKNNLRDNTVTHVKSDMVLASITPLKKISG
jgi:hypothetical protein